jgi:hypothetical protein
MNKKEVFAVLSINHKKFGSLQFFLTIATYQSSRCVVVYYVLL